MTAAVKTRLDKAVANKRITSAQEQKILERVSAGIKDLINATPPAKGQFPRMGHPASGITASAAVCGRRAAVPPSPAPRAARCVPGGAAARGPDCLNSRPASSADKLTPLSSSSHGFLIDGCCTGEAPENEIPRPLGSKPK